MPKHRRRLVKNAPKNVGYMEDAPMPRKILPLSDTAIRNAKPAAKPVKLFDGGGLYLEVFPVGGKLWRMKYRFGGKEKRLSFGAYHCLPFRV